MTGALVVPAGVPSGRLYGLVAWPSAELDFWIREQQQRLGVRAYGDPHLNLRAPFPVTGSEAELVSALRTLLDETPAFEVEVGTWRTFPSVVFLECTPSPPLTALHQRVMALPGTPDQEPKEYIPHLTLALGLLPWAQPQLEAELAGLRPPATRFTVSALTLTREAGGEVHEVRTFPLRERRPVSEPARPT